MLAVDTNIVVRLLTADDPRQTAQVQRIFARESVLIPKTVMLEAEWVLRRAYRFGSGQIGAAFTRLIGLPNVECEDAPAVEDAIQWMRGGLDFADALHLASARPAGRLATFDRKLIARARKIADVPLVRA
ncbi:MAG: type II toxin-antitoxin system VapC family toxin [Candidatus Binataceae bacterium]